MSRQQTIDTPRAGSWAEQRKTESICLHHVPMHPTFSEEQKLMNRQRRFPLVRVLGRNYAAQVNAIENP